MEEIDFEIVRKINDRVLKESRREEKHPCDNLTSLLISRHEKIMDDERIFCLEQFSKHDNELMN